MPKVYVLGHDSSDAGGRDYKLVGVYSSAENAQRAIERLREKSGFRDAPDGFIIDGYSLDEEEWTWKDGFEILK